jgi:DNA/RNA-binding domain of Phe-tRNA-synthetase-like protein
MLFLVEYWSLEVRKTGKNSSVEALVKPAHQLTSLLIQVHSPKPKP